MTNQWRRKVNSDNAEAAALVDSLLVGLDGVPYEKLTPLEARLVNDRIVENLEYEGENYRRTDVPLRSKHEDAIIATLVTPDELDAKREETRPRYIYEVFSDLIRTRWDGRRALLLQEDVIEQILPYMEYEAATKQQRFHEPTARQQIFDQGWLNVEPYFRKAGWKVTYDKQSYGDESPSTFLFERAEKK